MERTTEKDSHYNNLEQMTVSDILKNINKEDHTVPDAVEKAIPQLEKLVTIVTERMRNGGRLFYIGAGTSGRLGVVDASECPPTFWCAIGYGGRPVPRWRRCYPQSGRVCRR